jgi:hypothetical protein
LDFYTGLGDNIDTKKRNTETLADSSKEVGLAVNVEKLTVCCYFVTRMQHMKAAYRLFGNTAKFKYLNGSKRIKNLILGEIKTKLNSANACYYSVQNLLTYHLMSRNVKLLPVIVYECEPGSLTLREEHGLRFWRTAAEEDIWAKGRSDSRFQEAA